MPTIRTTLRPDLELEVSPAEHLDLQRQGLIAEAPSASHPDAVPATDTAPTKTVTAAEPKEG